ncbi:DUF1036 domain-containing protein [Streptomyces sp. NBC_01275]|uniref:DUF1036 domain-containing protein n=1 Tax=Streptomyces sp. NBC_01275 TaxID=2903807 RepID=UPI0022572CBC|nr:DUF1036 domain-containing protein [Streptomyces sp. NBC_01275]MCX4763564.1 DUF1036 domain-containing protein [Streptomyces sp. NBC_01275]
MAMRFRNNYQATIWAMVEWSFPNCPDGGDWLKKGWWQIAPGQEVIVYGGDADAVNRFWYAYAHTDDGVEWGGTFPELVPPQRFEWCEKTSSTQCRTINMHQFEVTTSDHVHSFNGG